MEQHEQAKNAKNTREIKAHKKNEGIVHRILHQETNRQNI
jgi:hypothetical protein